MGRIRSIKPEFFRHEELYDAENKSGLPLRVAFAGLFTVADRAGRFKWKPRTLKFDVLPWDDVDMNAVLAALVTYGFIKHYIVDGKSYGWIPTFADHQVVNNKESKSVLPEYRPDNDASFTRLSRVGDATLVEGKGREGRELIQLHEAVCEIFGRKYEPDPENVPPALVQWYITIAQQVQKILTVWDVATATKQVKAYIKHCNDNNRKKIGTDYKVAETILGSDWVGLTPTGLSPPPTDLYEEPRRNRNLWTLQAWEEKYDHRLKTDSEFRKTFGYDEKLRNGSTVGVNAKSRQGT
jgi:hypothetical protein